MKVLPVGTRLQCGSVLLEVTQIGKDCHSHCTIYYQMGKCIMPSNGIFARVLQDGWNKRAKDARLDLEPGTQTPDTAMSLTEEVQKLRQQTREQAKEIARLKEENEFLAEASAFFAASRRKSAKT